MFNDTTFYCFEVSCRGEEEESLRAEQIREYLEDHSGRRSSSPAGLYQIASDKKNKTITLAAFPWNSDKYDEKKLVRSILETELGADKSKIKKLSAAELKKCCPEAAETLRSLFRKRNINFSDKDGWEIIVSLESERSALSKIKNCGCAEFAGVVDRMNNCLRQSRKGSLSCGTVFVCENPHDAEKYIKLLKNYLVAKGAVKDFHYVTGDIDDAVKTDRNTAFIYRIDDDYDIGEHSRHFFSADAGDLWKLLGRKTIYITTMRPEEYSRICDKVSCFETIFPYVVHLEESTTEEKFELVKEEAESYGFTADESFLESSLLDDSISDVLEKIPGAVIRKLGKKGCDYILRPEDLTATETKRKKRKVSALEELDSLIGLEGVKKTVREIAACVRKMEDDPDLSLHMVFKGNPGTGKTTVARIIGRIFGELGILRHPDTFVEGDRSSLVAGYVGQTALKTKDRIKKAMGGVLFIDEAYALCDGNTHSDIDYGHEAVATLLKAMEDHRRDFVCILAGYPEKMDKMLDMNPGFRSRILFHVDFPDYSADEMLEIIRGICKKSRYLLDGGAEKEALAFFSRQLKNADKNFANGRTARNLYELAKTKQALRSPDKNDKTFTAEDIAEAGKALEAAKTTHGNSKPIGFAD